jgi:hypothetical protein
MAVRKPLVLVNGQIERLQPGDRIDVYNSASKNNNTGNTLVIGTPVYVNGGNAIPAQADSQSTVRVAGLVDATTTNNNVLNVVSDGVFSANTSEWDVVTGQTGGLTEGDDYFLSAANPGELTVNAPDSAGEFVLRVGHALSATEMEIEVGQPIKL